MVFFDQDGRDDVLTDLYRHLLNYCASAMALVDHTRNVYSKLLNKSSYWEEYEDKIKSDLAVKGHIQFIQKLRNYFLHYQSSGTNYSLGWKDGKVNNPFYLESVTLLRWDNWNSISKEYILKQGDHIDIKKTINAYNDSIYEFVSWLDSRHAIWFKEEFQEMDDLYSSALIIQKKLDRDNKLK